MWFLVSLTSHGGTAFPTIPYFGDARRRERQQRSIPPPSRSASSWPRPTLNDGFGVISGLVRRPLRISKLWFPYRIRRSAIETAVRPVGAAGRLLIERSHRRPKRPLQAIGMVGQEAVG